MSAPVALAMRPFDSSPDPIAMCTSLFPLFAFFLMSNCAQAAENPVTRLELHTWGFGGPKFDVSLDAAGQLKAQKTVARKGRSNESATVLLSNDDRQQIFALAAQVGEGPNPPEGCSRQVLDGSHASLVIVMGSQRVEIACQNAGPWLSEGSAAPILEKVNARLPETMRVF